MEVVTADRRRIEGWLTWVRGIGIVFALPSVLTTPYYPTPGVQHFVWGVTAFFMVGTVVVAVVNRRITNTRRRAQFTVLATAFDALVVTGYVLGFAYEQPYVTWSLTAVLPIAGALRYGRRGAVWMAAFGIVVFIGQSLLRARYVEEPMLSAQFYAAGLIALVAAAMSTLVESLAQQGRAYHRQALQLASAHAVKDQLMAVTSHEFRGALAAIATGAATVREHRHRLSDERTDRVLASMQGQVDQLLRLVDDLLVSSRADDRPLQMSPDWVDAHALVEVALDGAARHRSRHALDVSIEPLEVFLDRDRLVQVIRNLVENAYKYSPPGSAVSVALERVEEGCLIRVRDRGDGIPGPLRERLFEPYERGSDTGVEGTGLGLFVVQRIVSAAGGSVELRSSSSEGSAFVVRLPCPVRPIAPHLQSADGPGQDPGRRGRTDDRRDVPPDDPRSGRRTGSG